MYRIVSPFKLQKSKSQTRICVMPSYFQYTAKSLQCPFKNNWFKLVYSLFKLVLKPVATGRNLKALISSTSVNRWHTGGDRFKQWYHRCKFVLSMLEIAWHDTYYQSQIFLGYVFGLKFVKNEQNGRNFLKIINYTDPVEAGRQGMRLQPTHF